ncbi:MAG TPA: RimK family alpha-L-glutamate ligase, partial [Rhodoferax sp.]
PTIRLLALMAPGDMLDNTGFEFVVDDSDIRLELLYLLPGQVLPQTLPEHDLLIVAIGESDKNAPQLA